MGLETNARWMHSVHTDKRPENTKDATERGPRISLTFRHIGTFLTPLSHSFSSPAGQKQEQEKKQQQFIFGQGATGKTRAEARPVIHGGEAAERLLAAFGAENHQSEFDWESAYGEGFDVLHFTTNTPVSSFIATTTKSTATWSTNFYLYAPSLPQKPRSGRTLSTPTLHCPVN
jgi:hypothetical protein